MHYNDDFSFIGQNKIKNPNFITSQTATITTNVNNKNKIIYKYYFYYGLKHNRYNNNTKNIFISGDDIESQITDLEHNTFYYCWVVIDTLLNNLKSGFCGEKIITRIAPTLIILLPTNITNKFTILSGTIN